MISEELELENYFVGFDFTLAPNPTTHSFKIHEVGEPETIIGVQVINLLGQTLYQSTTYAGETITISNTAKGVHIVKITTPTKVILKKLLIH